ncbi:MAG: PDZ domain-containing protein [Deltaproteobacteria bacterium]|nr:PDZ domain-containing protein [Deltaproteobacteria bacterium]
MKALAPKWILGFSIAWASLVVVWAISAPSEIEKTPSSPEQASDATHQREPATARRANPRSALEAEGSRQAQATLPVRRREAPTDDRASSGAARHALSGLAMRPLTETDRETFKVPPRWSGVVVSRVEPDSAADAIDLRVGDVVVQAGQKKVEHEADLVEAVGQRDHTVLTIIRGGFLFQRVLRAPYAARTSRAPALRSGHKSAG